MTDLPENTTFPFNAVCTNDHGTVPGAWETAAAMAAIHEQMCVVADLLRIQIEQQALPGPVQLPVSHDVPLNEIALHRPSLDCRCLPHVDENGTIAYHHRLTPSRWDPTPRDTPTT